MSLVPITNIQTVVNIVSIISGTAKPNLNGGNKNIIGNIKMETNAATKLIKSFIFLRQNLERVTERDAKELSEILGECSEKFEKIVQRIKDEK